MYPYFIHVLAREREMEIRREVEKMRLINSRKIFSRPEKKQRRAFPDWVFGWMRREPTVCEAC